MAELVTIVCDMCGSMGAIQWRVVKQDGAPWIVDLCSDCMEPIVAMQKKGRSPTGTRRPYRKYEGKVKTTTEHDSEGP
jgi:ribosome-binding protein aMBF1 (putative translation factor)